MKHVTLWVQSALVVCLTVTVALPDSPQLQVTRELEEQQSGFLCTTHQASLRGDTDAGMSPWGHFYGGYEVYCLRLRVVGGVGRNVFLHVGKLFCGAPTPGCSSPPCPTEGARPVACPYLRVTREAKRCGAALGTMTGLQTHGESVGQLTLPFKDTTLTSRNDCRLCVDQRPHIMRVVLKGPGSDPLLVLLVHGRRHELKLDNGALRRPGNQAALVL